MLLAGNYRCITKDGMRTAQEAVHTDIETSRAVYNFVNDLCVKLGAKPNDLVPFEKYAAAAQSLSRPASAARALQNGAPNIERADKLVQLIAKQKGLSNCRRSTPRWRWSTSGSTPIAKRRLPRPVAAPKNPRLRRAADSRVVRKLSGLRGYGGLWTNGRFGRPRHAPPNTVLASNFVTMKQQCLAFYGQKPDSPKKAAIAAVFALPRRIHGYETFPQCASFCVRVDRSRSLDLYARVKRICIGCKKPIEPKRGRVR